MELGRIIIETSITIRKMPFFKNITRKIKVYFNKVRKERLSKLKKINQKSL